MPKTKAQIIAEAQVVKNATEVGENTATRVGGVLEDLADADGMVIIPVTGTQSGGNIMLSSNPFTQVQTAVNAGQHVVVRVTIASDIIDFTMSTYSASVATYIGTANFLENEFQLLCSASSAVITNRSTSNTFSTGESVPNVGIDATPTQGSDNLVKSGGVWSKVNELQVGAILLDGGIFNESYSTNAGYTYQNKGSVFKLFAGVSYEFHISCPTRNNPVYVRLRDLVSSTNIYDTTISASSTGRVLVYCPQNDTEVCILFGGAASWPVTIAVTNNQVAVQSSLLESRNEFSAQMYEKTSVQGVEYELGGITIANTGWTYADNASRVRTPKNYTIHLFPGDVIGLSDYTNAKFYWGCRDLFGVYTSGGWKTSDIVALREGYYVLCVSNSTDTTQTSARELGELIQITRNTTLGQLFDKVIKIELKIAGGAYGVHQEFPTIAGKKYIIGIPEQEWSVSNFGANETAFVVRTKSGSTYTDIAATRVLVNNFGAIRNTYIFEATTEISDIYIRANSGQTITFYVAEEDTPSVIGNYNQIKRLRTEADSLMVVSLPFGRYLYHHDVEVQHPIIPSQSLYDIAYAKALGFKAIEGNIQKCSDGVYVIKHGANGGKLGAGLSFAEGSGLSADTLFSSITSTELRQNVTYASTRVKYRGHIPTLAEFCQECARIGIAPFLRGANESVLAEARKYLPDEQIIIEWGLSRKDFKGLMTTYGDGATSEEILAKCKSKGRPFYYCWSSADTASESLFSEVAETLHKNGYVLAATYLTQNNFQRLRKIGLDMVVPTGGIIPPFYNGNVLNIVRGNDEDLILSGASYNSQDNTIEMDANGTIRIVNEKMGAFLSKVCIRLRYSGTLSASFTNHGSDSNLVSWESDGAETIELAIATYPGNNIVTILANEATTIYDIAVFGSVVM